MLHLRRGRLRAANGSEEDDVVLHAGDTGPRHDDIAEHGRPVPGRGEAEE